MFNIERERGRDKTSAAYGSTVPLRDSLTECYLRVLTLGERFMESEPMPVHNLINRYY
jgi:hypothetical protein